MRAQHWLTALLLAALPVGAAAQTTSGKSYIVDRARIVIDPCPGYLEPRDATEWQRWNRHVLLRAFGQHYRYADDNAALTAMGTPVQVVFMGNSIIDDWNASMFPGVLVDRGISEQTTPLMMVQFRADVIALKPQAVHIIARTNDVVRNTGTTTLEQVQSNTATIAEMTCAHGAKVILGAMNAWRRASAPANSDVSVDYQSAIATPEIAMKASLSSDRVHPTVTDYAVMHTLTVEAIRRTLANKVPR
ncbi:GDSL family lipase [Sphingomonas sp. S-NIH.Pt15_0812]|uniref:GDSL family lipase n=1 Tax=Sphingomonas sp. S-NIH.Pt15_0812 TaxID=1920129 RepID=UPI000F7E60EC|nr:GDSL family lipase [Sphingomonas sp. S-NIH.Pt15_0812]RSU45375.1 GDSL family lipase [Sphingomonas sp. S-NIH.Pt15_0812]